MQLHDVNDLEALVHAILRERLANMKAYLDEDAEASAYSYLLGEAWCLGLSFDPGRGIKFSTLLWRLCGLRLTDWYRREFIDLRWYKERPLSLDAMVEETRERAVSRGDRDDWAGENSGEISFLRAPDHADAVCAQLDQQAAIRRLPARCRLIVAAAKAGYGTEEIAAMIGVTPRQIRRLRATALRVALAS